MNTSRFAEINCSLSRTLSVMGDAWSALILRDIWLGVNRFDDLANDLGISRNLLTSRLKAMVDDDVIFAQAYQKRPVRNEYFLTTAGKELVPSMLTLIEWGERWRIEPGKAPLRVKHKGCGHYTHAMVVCSECGEPLTVDTIAPELGPGATATPGTSVVVPRFSAPLDKPAN